MATHGIRYAQGLQVVPLEAPSDITADNTSTWVKLENLQWLSFLIVLGAIGTSDALNIAVKSTTGSTDLTTSATDYALPFNYRLSSAVATDNWGDITAVTTAAAYVTIADTYDNKLVLIDLDPAVIFAHDSDAEYVYLDFDVTNSSSDPFYMGAVGIFEPRYPQNEQLDSGI